MVYILNNQINVLKTIISGVELVYNTILYTFGPGGKNVLIKRPNKIIIADDGVSVVNNIVTNDANLNIGVELCKSISNSINNLCGDGTTTSILLFYYFLRNSFELINNGVDSNVLITELKDYLKKMLTLIEQEKVDITVDSLEEILLSTTNNIEIIENVKKAYQLVDSSGYILLKRSNSIDFIKHYKGYNIYINNTFETKELNDIKVIIVNDVISSHFIMSNLNDDRYLIICLGINSSILNYYKDSNITIVSIKESTFDKETIFQDLETLLNISYSNKTINISKNIDILIENDVLILKDLTSQKLIDKLAKQMDQTLSLSKLSKLKERYAKITKGYVVIYVSGTTEEELENKVLIYEDAVKAGYNALKFGVCCGGGYIYYLLSKKVDGTYFYVIKESLRSLIMTLIRNSVSTAENIYQKLSLDTWVDLRTLEVMNISKISIKDSIYTIKEILKTVINNVCLLLNTKMIIFNENINKQTIDDLL